MQRLKTRPQFQAALAGGSVARTAHFVLHRLMLDPAAGGEAPAVGAAHALMAPGHVWLGALVPKRWARRAVTRNAIRRQIYRIASDFEPQLAPAAHVVRLRAAFDRKVYVSASSDALKGAVRDELRALFERANRGRP
jgi:ribonuclease P protein component